MLAVRFPGNVRDLAGALPAFPENAFSMPGTFVVERKFQVARVPLR